MSGAIVVEGIERYVPEVLNMRERILVLRDLVLPTDAAERKRVMKSVAMQTTQCGTAPEKPERAFTVNGSLRPADRYCARRATVLADRERQSRSLCRFGTGFGVTRRRGSRWHAFRLPRPFDPQAINEPRFGSTGWESGSNRHWTTSGFACCAAHTLLRYRSGWRFQSRNDFGRYRFGAATKLSKLGLRLGGSPVYATFSPRSSKARRSQRTAIRCELH